MIFDVVRIQGTLFCESDTVTQWKLAEICGAWNHDSDYTASHGCRGSCRQLRGFYTGLYLLTAVGFPPGVSSTVHIYTQTIHRTTQNKQYIEQHKNFGRMRAVPRLCGLYPCICLTTEEKARKNLSQGSRNVPAGTMKIHKHTVGIHFFLFLCRCDPMRVMSSLFLRFLDHTQRRTTVSRST
jgi:hypothetical protein